MPRKSNAEYQKAYRARKTAEALVANADLDSALVDEDLVAARRRIAELEEEVRQLKRQLAIRPVLTDVSRTVIPSPFGGGFGISRPAPKPSQQKGRPPKM
jgi:hypothetical protein